MKKSLLIISTAMLLPAHAMAQGATDGFNFSQPDLKGTARFMSMGGAFGALGGDLSTLSQNPAGIGVYRSSEIGFTLDLDCQSSKTTSHGVSNTMTQTKFLLNNIGGVATLRLGSTAVPNLNIGFTYNKGASFNRIYSGRIPRLSTSMSNYIAGVANSSNVTVDMLNDQNAYNPTNGYAAPWLTILGYDSYLISPTSGQSGYDNWFGQWRSGTSGSGFFKVQESGSVDEFNIALGGNISNIVYWGMNFDIVSLNFNQRTIYGESLNNAYVADNAGIIEQTTSDWDIYNNYQASGTGFKYSLGLIVKPIQELRLGFAVHTPTWYSMTENFYADTSFRYADENQATSASTNGGKTAYNDFSFRTPWHFIASVAGVIGNRLILSADYEWTPYQHMHFSAPSAYGYNYGYDYDYDDSYLWDYYSSEPTRASGPSTFDAYSDTNKDIKDYYQSTSTLRVGAEFRVTPQFSVRAGYSYVTSPVTAEIRDNRLDVYTAGTQPSYRLNNDTQYITCGLGYKFKKFYVDLAYVYKHISADYHAFTPDTGSSVQSPQAKVSLDNSQVVLSCGFRF